MSADGYLPPGTEHSHPYFHEPEPQEIEVCTHCGGGLDDDGECTQCGEPVSGPWTREDCADEAGDRAYDLEQDMERGA